MPPEWMVRAVVASASRARMDAGRIRGPFRKPTGQRRRSMRASRTSRHLDRITRIGYSRASDAPSPPSLLRDAVSLSSHRV